MSAAPGLVEEAIGTAGLIQTATGASSFVAAGVKAFGYSNEIPVQNMALVQWVPEQVDILFPGVNWLVRNIHYFNPAIWAQEAFRVVWQQIQRETVRQIAYEANRAVQQRGQEVGQQLGQLAVDGLARVIENGQWVLSTTPERIASGVSSAYQGLASYYGQLTHIRPSQQSQVARSLQVGQQAGPISFTTPQSGEFIKQYDSPGGAEQRRCPNWLLPLILGFYNTPVWTAAKKKVEETKPKNVYRKRKSSASSKTNYKRRRISTRVKNRA